MHFDTILRTTLLLLSVLAFPGGAATAPEAGAPDVNPCRPYPDHAGLLTEAWCTAKGIGNATVNLAENVLDGNYTTVQDYYAGVDEWQTAVRRCIGDPQDPLCPNLVSPAILP